MTQRPSMRWGSRAAFWSSGCLTMPWRSIVVKSSVVAIDRRPGGAVRGARDHPACELVDPYDTRVFESPLLGGDLVGGREQRLRVDRPAVGAVGGPCHGEVRDPAQVFDPCEENGLPVERERPRG